MRSPTLGYTSPMESSDFSIPFFEVKPAFMRGCGIVQIVDDQQCSAICALAFSESPFGRFEECVSFAFNDKDSWQNSQLFGISSKPKLSRSAYALVDNSHYLTHGSMRMQERINYEKKSCMIITSQSELELLRFELSVSRRTLPMPLIPGSTPAMILGLYAEKRFGSFHMLRGKFHFGNVISESFEAACGSIEQTNNPLLKLNRRIAEEFPHTYSARTNRTYIIDNFCIIVPERARSREFQVHKNKRVASNFACDS